jgi:hypothetical protein
MIENSRRRNTALGHIFLALFGVLLFVLYVTDNIGNPKVSDLSFPLSADFITPIALFILSLISFLFFRLSQKNKT